LLGMEEGRGFECVMSGLNNTRLTAAAGAVGVSQGLIDEAKKYANEREQFGRPIGKFQMVQEELARMIVETEAARLMVYKCAVQKDAGNLGNVLETVMPSTIHVMWPQGWQTVRSGYLGPTVIPVNIPWKDFFAKQNSTRYLKGLQTSKR